MYLDNKYTKWYYNIIESARQTEYDGYTEKHHIIPKCFGGSNDPENIVPLTARQHFICHWLLTKMVSEKKKYWQMMNALSRMMWCHSENHGERYYINSRLYEQLKAKHAKMLSDSKKGVKRKPFSDDHIKKMTAHMKGNTYGSKAVMVEGMEYISQTEAARKLGYSQAFVYYRLNSKSFPDYYYV